MTSDSSFTVRNLNKSLSSLSESFKKLSSGKRINSAKDDAAGQAIVAALEASVTSLSQASRNSADSQSALSIADGALSQISDISSRLKELATESANGTLSDEQRGALQTEYSQLTQEISRIAGSTEFNGQNLLDGGSFTSQVGTDSGPDSQISVEGTDVAAISTDVSLQNISTQAGAQAALASVDSLISNLASARGDIGAVVSRLDTASNNIATRKENEAAAAARIRDLDVAEETANLTAAKIKTDIGSAISAQANLNKKTVLDLLS